MRINWPQILLLSSFAIVFSLISLVNHYFFRTNAFDLGIFNHAMYDYAHFRFNDASLMLGFVELNNLLADHFSILHMAFAPLIYIFGTYTLLLVQIAAVLFGGWGIRRYLSLLTGDRWIPILAQFHFFISWGVISAIGFDYHDNVIGTMFVPHLLYFGKKGNSRAVMFFAILILLSRVEMAVWLCCICMVQILWSFRNWQAIRLYFGIALISVVYFTLITQVLIPTFSKDGYTQLHFKAFGNSPSEIILNVFHHPIRALSYLFIDFHGNSYEDFLTKRDFYLAFLISGGFLLILRPIFILFVFPVIAQKMLHDLTNKWGVGGHYSIETVLMISMGTFSAISGLRNKTLAYVFSSLLIISAACCTFYFMKNRNPGWTDTTPENFLIKRHYSQEFDVEELHRALRVIPPDALVSAQSSIVPQLAFRPRIYLYPYVADANYIIVNEKLPHYPIYGGLDNKLNELKSDKSWELIYNQNYTYIFRKIR